MTPVIQTKGLSVGYKSKSLVREVIHNLSISVFPGELVAIIGQNGIGKSTLLRTFCRLQHPLQGEIQISGKPLHSFSGNQFARKVSFVSTEIIRLNHCTVRQLVSFGRSPYTNWFGSLASGDENAVSEAIEMVGLTSLANRFINEISDGERQRVLIARTLAQDTDIIILDEPTAFLDMPNKFEVIHLLSDLTRQKNKTILFTSHDLTIAMKEADRLWLLTPGSFLDGAPEDLVLQHSISNMFRETRLNFDSRKGEFSIRRVPAGFCKIYGRGNVLLWTKKAMERLGYSAENETGEFAFEIFIEEKDNIPFWKLVQENNMQTFSSIYDLAGYLKTGVL